MVGNSIVENKAQAVSARVNNISIRQQTVAMTLVLQTPTAAV